MGEKGGLESGKTGYEIYMQTLQQVQQVLFGGFEIDKNHQKAPVRG